MLRALVLALSEVKSAAIFSKARKVLQFLFYSAMTYAAPYDFRAIPLNIVIIGARKDRKSQTARSHLSSVA